MNDCSYSKKSIFLYQDKRETCDVETAYEALVYSREERKMVFMVIIQRKQLNKTPYFCYFRRQPELFMKEEKQGKGVFQ